MRQAHAARHYEDAVALASKILSQAPEHPGATACLNSCTMALEEQYSTLLGGPSAVLKAVATDRVRGVLARDPDAALVVSLLDGTLTLGEVQDRCGARRLEALRLLAAFARMGVVRRT